MLFVQVGRLPGVFLLGRLIHLRVLLIRTLDGILNERLGSSGQLVKQLVELAVVGADFLPVALLVQFGRLRCRLVGDEIGVALAVVLVHLRHQVVWPLVLVHGRIRRLVIAGIADLPLSTVSCAQSSPFRLHALLILLSIYVEEILVQLGLILLRDESTVRGGIRLLLALLVHVGLSSRATLNQVPVLLGGTVPSRLRLGRRHCILLLGLSILSLGGDHGLVHGAASAQVIADVAVVLRELQMTKLRELCHLLCLILEDEIAETYRFLVVALVNIAGASARHLLVVILTHDVFHQSLLLLLQVLLQELLRLLLVSVAWRLVSLGKLVLTIFIQRVLVFLGEQNHELLLLFLLTLFDEHVIASVSLGLYVATLNIFSSTFFMNHITDVIVFKLEYFVPFFIRLRCLVWSLFIICVIFDFFINFGIVQIKKFVFLQLSIGFIRLRTQSICLAHFVFEFAFVEGFPLLKRILLFCLELIFLLFFLLGQFESSALLQFIRQLCILLHGDDLLDLFQVQVVLRRGVVGTHRAAGVAVGEDVGSLPEDGGQPLLDVLALDLLTLRLDLLEAFEVVDHVLDFRVWLHLAIADDLVVVVQVADVLHEGLSDALRDLDWQIQHERSAEVSARLH